MIFRSTFCLFLLIIFSSNLAAKDKLLSVYCDLLGGKVQFGHKCPKSRIYIPFNFCVVKRENKSDLFFDGCTGPTGGHTDLFYPHCIEHDLCYHKEPSTNGKSQEDCDLELKNNLLKSCQEVVDYEKCTKWANKMHSALNTFGKLAYNCADIRE